MRNTVVFVILLCLMALVLWVFMPSGDRVERDTSPVPQGTPVIPPPTLEELQQTHLLKGVNVDSDNAWVSISAPEGVRAEHVLVGDLSTRDYLHVELTGSPNAFLIKGDQCQALDGYVDEQPSPITLLTRASDVVRLYAGERLVATLEAPTGSVQVVMATPRDPAAPEQEAPAWSFAVQNVDKLQFADDFMRTRIGGDDGWELASGTWWIDQDADEDASPNAFSLQVRPRDSVALANTGRPFWNNYRYAATVSLKPESAGGLVFARDGDSSCRLVLAAGESFDTLNLVRVKGAEEKTLATAQIAPTNGRAVQLAVEAAEGAPIKAFADGVPLLTARADGVLFGGIGLFANGQGARFDDLDLTDLRHVPAPDALRPVVKFSKTYQNKPRYPKDDRDDFLQRWASDTDAWGYQKVIIGDAELRGWINSTELFGDLAVRLKPRKAARVLVIHGPDSAELIHHEFAASDAPSELAVRDGHVFVDGEEVGVIKPESWVRVGFYAAENVPFTSEFPELLSRNVRQEFFEQAPYDWMPVSGEWHLTNRWQCNPKWNFFGGIGPNDVVLIDKTAYSGDQCHEFYYGMKDVFGRQFENRRYSRHDVNVSFCMNGRDLNSGYTFMYGGFGNKGSALLKGDRVVAWNTKEKFGVFVDINDLHTFWWRVRIEKTGRRIVIKRDDTVIFDWTDTEEDAPDGGHLALWTYKNGIVYARVKSTAQKMADRAADYLTAPGLARGGNWLSLNPTRVRLQAGEDGVARVVNRFGGGAMAVKWTGAESVDLAATPRLKLPLAIGQGAFVNLHAIIGGRAMIFTFNAPTEVTHTVLGLPEPPVTDWQLYTGHELREPAVGGPVVYDAAKKLVEVDLLAEAKRRFPNLTDTKLTSLIVGNLSNKDYLMAGYNGNASGATYRVGEPTFLPAEKKGAANE